MEHRTSAYNQAGVLQQFRLLLLYRTRARPGGSGMALNSWIPSANDPNTDFPLANLPYGVFRHAHSTRMGVAIGDQILDLRLCASEGLFEQLPNELVDACTAGVLNPLMSLGRGAWSQL